MKKNEIENCFVALPYCHLIRAQFSFLEETKNNINSQIREMIFLRNILAYTKHLITKDHIITAIYTIMYP